MSAVAISPDGTWLATASSDHTASASTLSRALTGTALPPLKVVTAMITGCGGNEADRQRFATAWRTVRNHRAARQPARTLHAVGSATSTRIS